MLLAAWLSVIINVMVCFCYKTSWNPVYNPHHEQHHQVVPKDVMVDVVNDLGLKLLAIHNEDNENNIAISPYGAVSMLVALGEGLRGDATHEIQHAIHLPSDASVIRVGLRDIHRHLKSYFIPKEGFLAGLTLNHRNVSLNPEYEEILKFYGFDIEYFNNALYPDPLTTDKPQISITTQETTTELPTTTTTAEVESTQTTVQTTLESKDLAPTQTTLESKNSKDEMTTQMTTIQTTSEATTEATTKIVETTTEPVSTTRETTEATQAPTTTEEILTTFSVLATKMETTSEQTTSTEVMSTITTTESTTTTVAPSTTVVPTTTTESTTVAATTTTESTTIESTTPTTIITTEEVTTLSPSTITTTGTSVALPLSIASESTEATSTEVTETTEATSTESTEATSTESIEATSTESTESTSTESFDTTTNDLSFFMTTAPFVQDATTEISNYDYNFYGDATPTPFYPDLDSSENLVEQQNSTSFKRSARSVVDYIIAKYYDNQYDSSYPDYHDHHRPLYVPEEQLSFLVYGKYREARINFMIYDTVLPFLYVPHLNALALSFPLDSSKYYLLLLLPIDENGIDQLICDLRLNGSLKYIIDNLKLTHVKATIPSFMLKGYVVLTPTLQKLGIRKVFEPRHADFSPMTMEKEIYVTNIEQAVTITIKNYVNIDNLPNYRNLYQYDPVHFKADHPFLYFVIDAELQVALMEGKIVNPLNSRIR